MKTIAAFYTTRVSGEKSTTVFSSFIPLLISWTVVLLLMRIGEWLINGFVHQFPVKSFLFLSIAFLSDLIFVCKAGLVLFIVFVLLNLISFKVARITFIIIVTLLSLGYFALMQYFNSTLVLLGSDLYGYSVKDIQQTVGASGGLNIVTILLLLSVIACVIASSHFLSKKIKPGQKFSMALTAAIIVAGFFSFKSFFVNPSLGKEYDNNLTKNKIDYFLSSSWIHFFPEEHDVDIYADNYLDNSTPMFRYVDENNFPFLRSDSTADVLSPFLNKPATAPNIVIILVEGLGRAFTNEGAYLGNFTPFLDSLSKQSLYWKNFMSGGGRTFAVLPTILGSLPFGQTGFNEMANKPKHLSLPAILKKNGYYTSFFYAGDASFDNMNQFMNLQGVDAINDKGTFPAGYQQLPANNGFSWGYGDKELFRYFLDKKDKFNNDKPSLNVLLTVSTHSPFLIPDQAAYDQRFEQRMNDLHFNDDQKKDHRAYSKQYTTILYADDALKSFFAQYSKRHDYNNTIFLITGDHRMPEIPMATKLDRYHVPLIVYSPLLKRHAAFESISTHFDITPSLLAYMKTNFSIQEPQQSAWIGSGLDTTRVFQNTHAVALKQTKTDLVDFIMGDYHLNGDDLFKMNQSMDEEKVNDPAMKEKLQAAFVRFQQKNNELIKGSALMPDSLFTRYHP
jgi:uncharacterized sulfatase